MEHTTCPTCKNGARRPAITCKPCGGLGYFRPAHPNFRMEREPDDLGIAGEAPARCPSAAHEMIATDATAAHLTTFSAARNSFERNTREFVAALDRWYATDREDPHALYAASAWLTNISRNLSAYAGDMARAINSMENQTR